ncbi:MAG: recombinase family protein [Oscillospiraceae bacterium]|nr:recombinase family protein [Oscillospiraceae bacterium]
MNTKINAIYARQSVDKKDSISIESQIDFCKYELKGGNSKEYTDKGYSGKNTDRPRFKELISDIEQGLIAKVVVYKLDRISRSIIDFANMMELFQKYNVEFVSSTEKFDTSTPMGRAMLNICIVFAQLERETIQKRVTDAFYSRCTKGFHMTGKPPYGFKLTPTVVNGINTKMYETESETAERVKLMFEMYAEPQNSFGDIARYFSGEGISEDGREFGRTTISQLLKNPAYVQADLDVYEFFKSQGAVIVNDAEDFTGTNGCYLFQGRDVAESKRNSLKDQILVIAPHEGLISSDTWLTVRKKLFNNTHSSFRSGRKVATTWLGGKIKCGRCGYGLSSIRSKNDVLYFRCRRRADRGNCEGCGTLHVKEVEYFMYDEMRRKMDEFKTLTDKSPAKVNPKLTAHKVELAQTETEIEKLLNQLTGANAVLMSYANSRVEELDEKRQSLAQAIANMTAGAVSPNKLNQISGYLEDWANVDIADRRFVADGLLNQINITSDSVKIDWKI